MRWFYPGAMPQPVTGWFDALEGAPKGEEVRTDLYLHPTDGALGVKVRAGRLELKRAEGEHELCQLHPRVAGRLEHWRKWSFSLAQEPSALEGSGRWWAVRKARRLRSYRVGPERAAAASGKASFEGRCDLELARVEVAGQTWWSLCLEAYGRPERIRETFLQTAAYVFAETEPPALDLDNSLGYAEWLFLLPRRPV